MKKLKQLLILASFSLTLMPAPLAWADAPAASLSLSGGSYTSGDSFQSAINEDSGTSTVNVVDAEISYNAAQLQVVSIDTPPGDFLGTFKNDFSQPGKISLIRFAANLKGNATVGEITFKHLNGDSSKADILSTSQVLSAQNNKNIWDGVDNAGSYTFTAPQPQPVAAPIASPPTTTKSPTPAQAKPATPAAVPAGDTLADIDQLPKVSLAPTNTPAIYPYSDRLEILSSAGALVYLGALGWVIRSSHPAAVKVRSLKLRKHRRIDNQTI